MVPAPLGVVGCWYGTAAVGRGIVDNGRLVSRVFAAGRAGVCKEYSQVCRDGVELPEPLGVRGRRDKAFTDDYGGTKGGWNVGCRVWGVGSVGT